MEVPDQVGEDKFKVNDDYDFDKSRIAQWLRAIDTNLRAIPCSGYCKTR